MERHTINSLKIYNEIVNIAQNLEGQKCWRFKRSYGSVYNFDFGKKIKVGSTVMGEYWVTTCGTNFVVSKKSNLLVDTGQLDLDLPETILSVSQVLMQLIDQRSVTVQIDYDSLSLLINFDDFIDLKIAPITEDEQYEEPYWKIKFPDGKLLSVGRDRTFSYK